MANETALQITKTEEPQSILQIIADAAANPNINADKMSALLTLQERIMEHEKEASLNAALALLTPKLVRLKKSKAGAKTRDGAIKYYYTPREDIDAMLRPLLRDCGLSLSFTAREIGGKAWFVARVTEITKGGFKEAMMPYTPDSTNTQLNEPQKVSSGLSYAERHAIAMLFNLVTEGADDDAISTSVISREQAQQLRTLIDKSGANEVKFLAYMSVDALEEIQTDQFAKAVIQLTEKINRGTK